MNVSDLHSMTLDELWSLHQQIASVLARKLVDEKARLEERLQQLAPTPYKKKTSSRRPYPQVFPKYRNPSDPAETWAGRGKQPRWLASQLRSGKKLDDFRIQRSNNRARRSAR